jgi:hypothetical protein
MVSDIPTNIIEIWRMKINSRETNRSCDLTSARWCDWWKWEKKTSHNLPSLIDGETNAWVWGTWTYFQFSQGTNDAMQTLVKFSWMDFCQFKYMEVLLKANWINFNAPYLVLSFDEVIIIDNISWIPMHYYIVQDFVWWHNFVSLEHVIKVGSISTSLTILIMGSFTEKSGVSKKQIAEKFLCFGSWWNFYDACEFHNPFFPCNKLVW